MAFMPFACNVGIIEMWSSSCVPSTELKRRGQSYNTTFNIVLSSRAVEQLRWLKGIH